MKKIFVVFGTRPEAIKMCPLILALKKERELCVKVCVTGQHKQMLEQVLNVFKIIPDYNLEVMQHQQTLFDITILILNKIQLPLTDERPDMVLVHGDTSTTFATALACYYLQIPVGHVEAGLRTYNIYSPYPEEFNRQAVGVISRYHFAPTEATKNNLIQEGKKSKDIFVTGNTAIDALKITVDPNYEHDELKWAEDSKLILLTAHRRENLGKPLEHIFKAITKITSVYPDIKVIYPVHLNPRVRQCAEKFLGNNPNVHLIEPLDVLDFHNFMSHAFLIMTDSGGIQEEAPSLGKPVLVLRETTERPEGIKAGTLKLVGVDENLIFKSFQELIENKEKYNIMAAAQNPYGDGFASERIVRILKEKL